MKYASRTTPKIWFMKRVQNQTQSNVSALKTVAFTGPNIIGRSSKPHNELGEAYFRCGVSKLGDDTICGP